MRLLVLLCLLLSPGYALTRIQGWCSVGAAVTVTNGFNSSTKTQGSYPQCTVTVTLVPSGSDATIYSNNTGSSLSNPFTADTQGHWYFYVPFGRYNVTISGGGLGSPYSFGDFTAFDPYGDGCTAVSYVGTGTGPVERSCSSKLNDFISVKDFGAVGDCSTDDTSAIQAAIDWADTGYTVFFPAVPDSCYKITSAISVPSTEGLNIKGDSRSGVEIRQFTGNTPVFDLVDDNWHSWSITDLYITASSPQPSSSTNSVGIYFDPTAPSGNGYYEFEIRRINFKNLYRGIATNPVTEAENLTLFGFHIGDIMADSSLSGATVYIKPSPPNGQPRCNLDNIWSRQSISEAQITLAYCTGGQLTNLEHTPGNAPVLDLTSNSGLTVTGLHVELGSIVSSNALVIADNSWIYFDTINASFANNSGGQAFLVRNESGGGQVSVFNTVATATNGSGATTYLLYLSGANFGEIGSYALTGISPYLDPAGVIARDGPNWRMTPAGLASNSTNYNSLPFRYWSSYWNGSAAAIDAWSDTAVLGSGTNPSTTLRLAHGGSSGSAFREIDTPQRWYPGGIPGLAPSVYLDVNPSQTVAARMRFYTPTGTGAQNYPFYLTPTQCSSAYSGGLTYFTSPNGANIGSESVTQAWLADCYGNTLAAGDSSASHFASTSSTPSLTFSTGAGSGASGSVSGNDIGGVVTVLTGTSPSTDAGIAFIGFATTWAVAPNCTVSPANIAAVNLGWVPYANAITTRLTIGAGGTALSGATTYEWNYTCP